MNKLVRHPAPKDTESLAGYVLRLAELNGYSRISDIFRIAEMDNSERAWGSFNAEKIATLIQTSAETLKHISFKAEGDQLRDFRLLGHKLLLRDLSLDYAKVCPECISEYGYIDACFNLDLMIGCPIHARQAAWFCGICKNRLRWNRKGLLRCHCGANIKAHRRQPSMAEISLLGILKTVLHKQEEQKHCKAGLPIKQLMELDLENLVALVRFLGNAHFKANRKKGCHVTSAELLCRAALVLTDWPNGYKSLLEQICPWSPISDPEIPSNLLNLYAIVYARQTDA